MERYNWFYGQYPTEGELDDQEKRIEEAIGNLLKGLVRGTQGVLNQDYTPTASTVPDWIIHFPAFEGYSEVTEQIEGAGSHDYQARVFWDTEHTKNCQYDYLANPVTPSAGMLRYIAVFAKFLRVETVPRLDKYGLTIYFHQFEGFELVVYAGTQHATDPVKVATPSGNFIKLCDVKIDENVGAAGIDDPVNPEYPGINEIDFTGLNYLWLANKEDLEALQADVSNWDYQNSVLDMWDASAGLPGSPSVGDRYICSVSGNGWTANNIYEFGVVWEEIVPNEGFTLRVEDEDKQYTFNGTSWARTITYESHQDLADILGADETSQDTTKNKHVNNKQLYDIWDEIDGIVGGGVEINNIALARENITLGDAVMLNQNGYYKSKYEQIGSTLQIEDEVGGSYVSGLVHIGGDYYAVAHNIYDTTQDGNVSICKFTNGVLTKVVTSEFASNATGTTTYGNAMPIVRIADNRFAIMYYDNTTGRRRVVVGEFDGTSSVSWLAYSDVNTESLDSFRMASLSSDNYFVIFFQQSDNTMRSKVGYYNASSITWTPATPVTIHTFSGSCMNLDVLHIGDNYILYVYDDGVSGHYLTSVGYWTGSGINIVSSAEVAFATGAPSCSNGYGVVSLGKNLFAIFFEDQALSPDRIKVSFGRFHSGNTIEFFYKDKVLTDAYPTTEQMIAPRIAYIGGNKIIMIQSSNSTTTYYNIYQFSENNMVLLTYGVMSSNPLSGSNICNLKDGLVAFFGVWSSTTNIAYTNVFKYAHFSGLAKETITVGNNIQVQHKGSFSGLSGLIPGARYYIDIKEGIIKTGTSGNINELFVGESIDSNKLILK